MASHLRPVLISPYPTSTSQSGNALPPRFVPPPKFPPLQLTTFLFVELQADSPINRCVGACVRSARGRWSWWGGRGWTDQQHAFNVCMVHQGVPGLPPHCVCRVTRSRTPPVSPVKFCCHKVFCLLVVRSIMDMTNF